MHTINHTTDPHLYSECTGTYTADTTGAKSTCLWRQGANSTGEPSPSHTPDSCAPRRPFPLRQSWAPTCQPPVGEELALLLPLLPALNRSHVRHGRGSRSFFVLFPPVRMLPTT